MDHPGGGDENLSKLFSAEFRSNEFLCESLINEKFLKLLSLEFDCLWRFKIEQQRWNDKNRISCWCRVALSRLVLNIECKPLDVFTFFFVSFDFVLLPLLVSYSFKKFSRSSGSLGFPVTFWRFPFAHYSTRAERGLLIFHCCSEMAEKKNCCFRIHNPTCCFSSSRCLSRLQQSSIFYELFSFAQRERSLDADRHCEVGKQRNERKELIKFFWSLRIDGERSIKLNSIQSARGEDSFLFRFRQKKVSRLTGTGAVINRSLCKFSSWKRSLRSANKDLFSFIGQPRDSFEAQSSFKVRIETIDVDINH